LIEGLLKRASLTKSFKELSLLVVNEARGLVSCEHCSLIQVSHGAPKITAISHVPVVDRTAPFVQWLESVAQEYVGRLESDPVMVNIANLSEGLATDWNDLAPPAVLFVPIQGSNGALKAILAFARHDPFSHGEMGVAQTIGSVWALATRSQRQRVVKKRGLATSLVLVTVVLLALVIQVPMTVLGEAQIEAENSQIVTVPFDGIVAKLSVDDGQSVAIGDDLFSLERSQLEADLDVALQASEVAKADFTRVQKQGFRDAEARRSVASKEAEYRLRVLEARIAEDRLNRSEVTAERSGIIRLDETDGWIGRPVRAGQRVLEISDPSSVEASVYIPVKDAIALQVGNPVRVFLDDRPDEPFAGQIASFSYAPKPSPLNVMSYEVSVKFPVQPENVGLGVRGSARVYSDDVSLLYYLFRRPLLFVIQHLGI
jgi:multidrug efflux pump subunit AcrA (membrane-fusion protein)